MLTIALMPKPDMRHAKGPWAGTCNGCNTVGGMDKDKDRVLNTFFFGFYCLLSIVHDCAMAVSVPGSICHLE